MKKIKTVLPVLLIAGILSACNNAPAETTPTVAPTEAVTEAPETTPAETTPEETTTAETEADEDEDIDADLYANFKKGSSPKFECSNGWTNGDPFDVTWRKKCVTFEDNKMQLIIDNDVGGKVPYAGGEYRSLDFYGYGRYEVSMKAIKNDGVVSSFFTYTGPTDGNPWDEIDIEILGKDTTKVQFNYYTNGRGGHEYMYDLGFDASEDFHTYAFEWHEDKIVWFVDGEEAYTAEKNLPSTPGKLMMNAWCGKGVDGWLKAFDNSNLPLVAEYEWLSFKAF